MKKKLYHIYFNTSGNSGLYLNPIYDCLKKEYDQKLFVNYYYPLNIDCFEKRFFKLTEKNEHNKHKLLLSMKKIRKVIRYIELLFSCSKLMKVLKKDRPEIINYSLTNMPNAYAFLSKIKKQLPGTKIVVTCHDVLPYKSTQNIPYKKIYDLVDYLLIHNEASKKILEDEYKIDESKILFHPFPLINLELLKDESKDYSIKDSKKPNFLFIGVMREEKGVQLLVDAWEKLGENFDGNLIIAGFKPDDVEICFDKIANYCNFKAIIRSLSDEEYTDLINETDYVVFPYLKVGNSGVLSTVISLKKVPIVTKLKVFEESEYVNDKLMCNVNDINSICEKLEEVSKLHNQNYEKYKNEIISRLDANNKTFNELVIKAYNKVK